jgi:hypothetical protein
MSSAVFFDAPLRRRLGHFSLTAQVIARAAAEARGPGGEAHTLMIAMCGSRGADGGEITPGSDADMLIVARSAYAAARLRDVIAEVPQVRVCRNAPRATRRVHQAPRWEDVLELKQLSVDAARAAHPAASTSAGAAANDAQSYCREIGLTILTQAEFQAKYRGVGTMFDEARQPHDISEEEMAKHNLMSGFCDSRLVHGTAVYDPRGLFAEAQREARLSAATSGALFRRHLSVLQNLLAHVGRDWKNDFERSSDQAIIVDALIRAQYALAGKLCQPGYKRYPLDAQEFCPRIAALTKRIVSFGLHDGRTHRALVAEAAERLQSEAARA